MAEITKTSIDGGSGVIPGYLWASFAVLVVVVYLFGLDVPLLGPDEPRYAQVAREMLERGDPVTPTLGGFHWFEKPALLYWLQITFFQIFGVSEFSARFGSALFGLGTTVAIWTLGRFAGSGNWLGLIAASTLGIIVFARGASFDIMITFPISAALISFFIFDEKTQSGSPAAGTRGRFRSGLALILFYVFTGVAILAKGLIGIVFPFAIVGLYHVIAWRMPSRRLLFSVVWGTLLALVVASLWYVPMYIRHSWEFIDEFFVQHHFQRYTSNKYQHPQPFYFFIWVLPLMTLPWMPFLFVSIWRGARHLAAGRHGVWLSTPPIVKFSIAWLAVPLLFFSFSGSKLPGYILPAVPPAIVLIGVFLNTRISTSRGWAKATFGVAVVFLLVVLALTAFVVPRFAEDDSVKALIAAADARGYAASRVLMFYTLSHNAEFYAAGRLARDDRGRQRTFYRPADLVAELEREPDRTAMVMVSREHLSKLTADLHLTTEVIADNGELAIVAATVK